MINTVNLLAVVIGLLLMALAITHLPKPGDVEESPVRPVPQLAANTTYRVSWSDKLRPLDAPPEVVLSKGLTTELYATMQRQAQLLASLMGIECAEGDTQRDIDNSIKLMIDALMRPEVTRGSNSRVQSRHRYIAEVGGKLVIRYDIYVGSEVNDRLRRDFEHIMKTANPDNMEKTLKDLEFKLDSWNDKVQKYPQGNSASNQVRADRDFLSAMDEYVEHWKAMSVVVQNWKKENPTGADARVHWGEFERTQQPELNAYIEGNESQSWPLDEANTFTGEFTFRDALYLRCSLAGRVIYLPLQPNPDTSLGLAMAPIR